MKNKAVDPSVDTKFTKIYWASIAQSLFYMIRLLLQNAKSEKLTEKVKLV